MMNPSLSGVGSKQEEVYADMGCVILRTTLTPFQVLSPAMVFFS